LGSVIAMRAYIAIAAWLVLVEAAQAESLNPAEVAFEKGRLLAEANLHARACAAFELSQRLDPQFGTQFNLAGSYASAGKLATALRLYRELSRSDSNASRRAKAAELAAELEPRVPKVQVGARIDQQTPDLRVFVGDTEVTSLLDVDVPFDPGHYVISAIRPGYRPFQRTIHIRPKEVASVVVELEPEPAPGSEPEERPKRSKRALAGKITLSVGTGLAAFGAVATWRWYVNDSSDPERAKLWGPMAGVALVSGVTGAIVGGGLLLESRDSGAVRVTPSAGADSASVLVSGSF
jgi:tetratricopeptide (TPR) repeat protein